MCAYKLREKEKLILFDFLKKSSFKKCDCPEGKGITRSSETEKGSNLFLFQGRWMGLALDTIFRVS